METVESTGPTEISHATAESQSDQPSDPTLGEPLIESQSNEPATASSAGVSNSNRVCTPPVAANVESTGPTVNLTEISQVTTESQSDQASHPTLSQPLLENQGNEPATASTAGVSNSNPVGPSPVTATVENEQEEEGPEVEDVEDVHPYANYFIAERRAGSKVYMIQGYGHLFERLGKNGNSYLKCMSRTSK